MHPWDIVFLVGFAAYIAIRGWFDRRTQWQEKAVSLRDVRERAVIFLVFCGCLVLPAIYLFTPWLSFADYGPPFFRGWCGVVVMAVALWLFWRAHADLGQNWSVTLELRRDHQLVKHGVYRSIRHPMYASIWLFGLAQGLLLRNWLAGWSAMAAFAVMYLIRVPREELMMREAFGEEYDTYMSQTGRLFPRLRHRHSVATGPGSARDGRRDSVSS